MALTRSPQTTTARLLKGPIHYIVEQYQSYHGLLQDGFVGPQVYGSCGNSIKVWHINDNEYCSFSDCRKPGSNPFLVIFGNGKFGIFVRECEEHPLENVLNTVVIPFQTPNTVEAAYIMRGMRAVSEVMES